MNKPGFSYMKSSHGGWVVRLALLSLAGLVLLSNFACKKSNPKNLSLTPSADVVLSPEAAQQQKLEWNLVTLVKAYGQAGHDNLKWNEAAKRALAEFARSRAQIPGADPEVIATNAAAAVQAGCDDPMVNYVFIKYSMSQTNSKEAFTAVFKKTALDMEASSYPPIRKFYATFRTWEQYGWANNWPTNWPNDISNMGHRSVGYLSAVLSDPSTPALEVYDACHDFLNDWGTSKESYPKFWQSMEPLVFKYWSNDSSIWLLKGEACIRMAWLARGNDYANKVTQKGWESFSTNLVSAQSALEQAWKMNPKDVRIPIQMMNVMLGEGGGRDRMELWFDRAIKLDPGNYDACWNKLYYLEPKWYGSIEDMLTFGRECVKSTATQSKIPLILVNAHDEIYRQFIGKSEQSSYWQKPTVWNDVKSAYDRLLELNPDWVSYRHNYAQYAYQSEQWGEFLHQVSLFSSGTNYDYFGGKEKFDQMVKIAIENTSSAK